MEHKYKFMIPAEGKKHLLYYEDRTHEVMLSIEDSQPKECHAFWDGTELVLKAQT